MAPNTKIIHLSNGDSYEGTLIVINEYACGNASRRQYRLYWQNPADGGRYAVPAYGLCSEPLFSREKDAVAQGIRDFGIRAQRHAW